MIPKAQDFSPARAIAVSSRKLLWIYLCLTYARLNEIINKHRKVTASSALTFADALGTKPEFWLNLQQQYDLWYELKKHNHIEALPQIAESSTSLHP
jgi:addiction module HigA family antidote